MKAWDEEKPVLAPVPLLPEPFDLAVMRRVAPDCTVPLDGRRYSVPFEFLDRRVEGAVQLIAVLGRSLVGNVVLTRATTSCSRSAVSHYLVGSKLRRSQLFE